MRYSSCFTKITMAVCFTIGLLAGSKDGYSQRRPVTYTASLSGVLGSLAKDSSRIVRDSISFTPLMFPEVDTTVSINNMVVLYIDENSLRMPPDSFKVDVDVRVYYYNRSGVYDSITTKRLSIDYNVNKVYNNKAVLYFKDAPQVNVKILNIAYTYSTAANILPLLKLENRMAIDRIFGFECSDMAIKTIQQNTTNVSTKGELTVSWASVNAAHEYDLEWTFIDQSALDSNWYQTAGVFDPSLLFKNNATRVTIVSNNYNIPLLYEGDGKLYYRVRAAQKTIEGERKTTPWSSDYPSDGGLGEYSFTGHERALNWQWSTSFAEEGKRKSVVQYFDGSMRNRQVVTRDNTTDTSKTIVAETFYDRQGRSKIQVLPSPSLKTIIEYTPLFNHAAGGIEYGKDKYDSLATATDYCGKQATAFDSVGSGAAMYYSANNPDKNKLIDKYIPVAKGYPFTEVKYTQDNTGRIAAQGGVGPEFQLTQGHETKYYYGIPEQADLDALFGTEAGYASHYQKNMVRDANGQYSVSYVDMHGRTVATALAGQEPASLEKLPSRDSVQRTVQLLNQGNNLVTGTAIVSTKGLVVAKAGTHFFEYVLNAESLSINDKTNTPVCYDCLYDLTITISNDCNNQGMPGDTAFVRRRNNMRASPPIYDTTCANAAGNFSDTFSIYLPEGGYFITKKLSLREDARDWYRDSLYTPHNTVKTRQDIINDQRALIRQRRAGDCAQPGEPWYLYDQYREQMLLDMTPPFGQYAQLEFENPSIFSIFQGVNSRYLFQTLDYAEPIADLQSMTPETFTRVFQLPWAETLIKKHPEYRKLVAYESFTSSYHWDADFETTETYAAALSKGYLNPTNMSSPPRSGLGSGNDSLILMNATAKSWLTNQLVSFQQPADGNTYSLWALASIMGHCDTRNQSCVDGFRTTPSTVFGSSMCEGELNMAWRFFRDQYSRLKYQWIDDYINTLWPITISAPATPVFLTAETAFDSDNAFFSSDVSVAHQAVKDSMRTMANSSCQGYASRWWEQLANCNYTTVDSAAIMPLLINVCKEGADSTHPFGASSVRPSSTGAFRSFEEVINWYNGTIGKPNNAACNAFLIDGPIPYFQPIAVVEHKVYSKPDSCSCTKIKSLEDEYKIQTTQYGSLVKFIEERLHTTISNNVLDSLIDLCRDSITCRYIASPLSLPPALQCGSGNDVCVNCDEANAAYSKFKFRYPAMIPGYEEPDAERQGINKLFSSFMNNTLGFSKTTQEYLSFMVSCGSSFVCDSLQALKNRYRRAINPYRFESYNESSVIIPTTITDPAAMLVSGTLRWPIDVRDTTGRNWALFKHKTPNTNSNKFCTENGYAVEWRFKSLKKVLNADDDVFYFQDDNVHFTISKNETGTPGLYLREIKGRTTDHTSWSVVFTGTQLLSSNPDTIYNGWNTIKVMATSTRFKVYFNNTLVKDVARTAATLVNETQFTMAYQDFQAAIDWVKMYDAAGSLAVFEDYNEVATRSVINAAFLCPQPAANCQAPFVTYFNQQKGTSYTYSQIDSVYLKTCGKRADICSAVGASACDTMQQMIDGYKRDIQIDTTVFSFRGNSAYPTPPENVSQSSQVISGGYAHAPARYQDSTVAGYPGLFFNLPCNWNVRQTTGFSIETKVKLNYVSGQIVYFHMNGFYAYYQVSPIGGSAYAIKAHNLTYNSIQGANSGEALDTVTNAFSDWVILKLRYDKGRYQYWINGALVKEYTSASKMNTISQVGLGYTGSAYPNAQMDWLKIYGEDDKVLYVENFDDAIMDRLPEEILASCQATNCTQDFATYYNLQKGTSYTFNQIDSVYSKTCGTSLNVCGSNATAGYADTLNRIVDSFFIVAKRGQVGHVWGTGDGNPVFNRLSQLAHNGVLYLPDTIRQITSGWYNNYQWNFNRYCTQSGYTVAARFKFFTNQFGDDIFYLGFRGLEGVFSRYSYGGIPGIYLHTMKLYAYDNGIPEIFPGQILIDNNSLAHLDWMEFKAVIKPDRVWLYYNGRLIWEHSRNPAIAIAQQQNFSLGLRGRNAAIDWIRVGDVNDVPKYFEDYNDTTYTATVDESFICNQTFQPCQVTFTSYFNQKRGTSYTFPQIDSVYNRAGIVLDVCDEKTQASPSKLLLCGRNEPTTPALRLEDVYDPPCSDSTILATNSGTEMYTAYKDSLDNSFNEKYHTKCLAAASIESFTVKHTISEYHYTLYYYDQAGNLVKTIAPAGVQANRDPGWLAQIKTKRAATQKQVPDHIMPTLYRYNSLNQVVAQRTPDAGLSANWYDRLGRLAVSQNAQQKLDTKYSYTIYDTLGRILEVGQKPQPTAMTQTISRDPAALDNWIYYNNGSNTYGAEMVTQTTYDDASVDGAPCPDVLEFTQKSYTIRNRVSYTRYFEKPGYYLSGTRYYVSGLTYTTGIDYSYDIHGNVDTMRNLYGSMTYGPMAHHGANACKTIAYTYDLISGKVNEVHYNPGQNDEFYHRYEYDAENRLTHAYTTDNKLFLYQQGLEDREAWYTYYKHGPMARMIAGQLQVNANDYGYTLQGWLKGINGSSVRSAYDMGGDALTTGVNRYVAKDQFGLTLNYFVGDYQAINNTVNPFPNHVPFLPGGAYNALYNGNISSMMYSLPLRYVPYLYNYKYDQLNRLVSMDVFQNFSSTDNHWENLSATAQFKERYNYDPNGNILKVLRNGNLTANLLMDSLTYKYQPYTNRLDFIRDRNSGSTAHANYYGANIDVKDQTAGNYQYDAIGNLKSSVFRGTDNIKWNVYGKVEEVTKQSITTATSRMLHNYYDPSGNRVGQAQQFGTGGSATYDYVWTVRDAQGNAMAVYKVTGASSASAGTLKLIEHHMYGSSRLGIIKRNVSMDTDKLTPVHEDDLGNTYLVNFTRGEKLFEVSNHLGNVVTIVSDKRLPVAGSGSPTPVSFYNSEMLYAADYTPFGMTMNGRNYNTPSEGYRYGFNGQEHDNEVKGDGNNYTAEFWQYDPQVGRRWNLDPVRKEGLSGYSVNGLNPIAFKDPNGDDWYANGQGMFIWSTDPSIMMLGFNNYYGTELPEGVREDQILTTIPGQPGFYYKNKSDWLGKFINGVTNSNKNPTLKKYSWHDVAIGTELRDYAMLGALSPLGKTAASILKGSGGSIWKITSWVERGFVYERMKGANLTAGFEVIDKFVKGVATSIKTLDLGAPTYLKEGSKAVFNRLKKYIDDLAEFKGAAKGEDVVLEDQIKKKVLDVGIPKGATKSQIEQLQEAIKYGKENGIKVKINVVK